MNEALQRVLYRLSGVKRNGSGGYEALCPVHEDRRPSLSIAEGEDDQVLLHCHAGCSPQTIIAEIGLEMRDLFPSSGNGHRNGEGKPTAVWEIRDAEGELQAEHVRFDGPDDMAVYWRLQGAKYWGLQGRKLETMPLYRSEHTRSCPEDVPVVVVEGEKAADALTTVYPAVLGTVTGASGTPRDEALAVLRGRRVVLWPDADEAGRVQMERVAEALQGIAAEVRIFERNGAPKDVKGPDAADHPVVTTRTAAPGRRAHTAPSHRRAAGSPSSSRHLQRAVVDRDAHLRELHAGR
jgi:putative DNA primase/helicase